MRRETSIIKQNDATQHNSVASKVISSLTPAQDAQNSDEEICRVPEFPSFGEAPPDRTGRRASARHPNEKRSSSSFVFFDRALFFAFFSIFQFLPFVSHWQASRRAHSDVQREQSSECQLAELAKTWPSFCLLPDKARRRSFSTSISRPCAFPDESKTNHASRGHCRIFDYQKKKTKTKPQAPNTYFETLLSGAARPFLP